MSEDYTRDYICRNCGDIYTLRTECEPTEFCDVCAQTMLDDALKERQKLRIAVTEAITHFGIIASFDGDDPDCPYEDPGHCARAALSKIKEALDK